MTLLPLPISFSNSSFGASIDLSHRLRRSDSSPSFESSVVASSLRGSGGSFYPFTVQRLRSRCSELARPAGPSRPLPRPAPSPPQPLLPLFRHPGRSPLVSGIRSRRLRRKFNSSAPSGPLCRGLVLARRTPTTGSMTNNSCAIVRFAISPARISMPTRARTMSNPSLGPGGRIWMSRMSPAYLDIREPLAYHDDTDSSAKAVAKSSTR